MSDRTYTDEYIIRTAIRAAIKSGRPISQLRQEDWPISTVSLQAAIKRFGWGRLKRLAAEEIESVRHVVEERAAAKKLHAPDRTPRQQGLMDGRGSAMGLENGELCLPEPGKRLNAIGKISQAYWLGWCDAKKARMYGLI